MNFLSEPDELAFSVNVVGFVGLQICIQDSVNVNIVHCFKYHLASGQCLFSLKTYH